MASRTFYRRRFLNRRGHHGGAFVLADIHPEKYLSDGREVHDISAFIAIADCSRVATIDFDVHTAADARNALHKAHLLLRVITDFVDALEQAAIDREETHSSPAAPPAKARR
jgi:hypothetical protein